MPRIVLSFLRMGDADLEKYGENVLVKLTGNGVFANPDPALTVLETDLQGFRGAMVDAALGDRKSIQVRDQKRAALEQTLRFLGYYVEKTALGDKALILSAGYTFAKEPERSKPCPMPTGLQVEYGLPGSGLANVKVKPEKLARAYRFEYRQAGTEAWMEQIVTRSFISFHGLEPMQTYEFRVACIGTDPTVTYSKVVSSLVL